MLVWFLLHAALFSSLAFGVASAAASSTIFRRGEGRLWGPLRLRAGPHSGLFVVMEKLYIFEMGSGHYAQRMRQECLIPFGIGLMRLQNIAPMIRKDLLTRFQR
jgi:hypothetical protein